MRQRRFTAALSAGVLVVSLAVLGSTAGQAEDAAFDPGKAVFTPVDQMEWIDLNEAIRFGHGFGDRWTGQHGTFGTFPPKFITPVHKHTNGYHAVVLIGTMTNPMGVGGEANPVQMGPGSYWYVPAEAAHATACVSDGPCKFYMHGADLFDFHVIE